MRILALAILAIGAISAAAPARAQTYGAGYPVCLHWPASPIPILSARPSRSPPAVWVQLYVAASMQRVGLGPLGAMRRQSLLGKCVSGSANTQARRLLSAVLT